MADDNSARNRSNDSLGREPAAPASDPLAELARLIGQNDRLSASVREMRAAPQPDADVHPASDPAPQDGHDPAPRYAADNPPQASDVPASPDDWPGSPAPAPSYPPSDPFPPPPRYSSQAAPPYDNPGDTSPGFPSPSFPSPDLQSPDLQSPGFPRPGFLGPDYPGRSYADDAGPPREGYQPERSSFDAPGYAAAPERQGYEPPLYPHDPETGGMPPPHKDEFYDDEPRGGRRKGLLVVVAVLGLAVLGTAGAFGYRNYFGSARSASPPPVIRASGEPSKVAPPPATPDPAASKFSYDRFGDAGKDEQVVKREEKPVDLAKAAPPPPAPAAGSTAAKSAGIANPPSAIGEPRRVRTVPIRPDQGGDAATAPLAQQPTSAALRQANAKANANTSAGDAAPRGSARMAMRPAAPAGAPAANAPLSLSPDANNAPLPPPAQAAAPPPPARVAPPPPARVASAPARAPAASGGGGYVVQVSSQRSEADAATAYRGIQSKYSSVLGNQPHTVRRADLGAKGVYYRAMVGPFASREEALQLCTSLKQAGGDCVVQH